MYVLVWCMPLFLFTLTVQVEREKLSTTEDSNMLFARLAGRVNIVALPPFAIVIYNLPGFS